MADLTRWEPFRDVMTLRDAMNRLFEESFVRPFGALGLREDGENVAIDMYETDNDVVVKASLPGIKPEEVDVTVTGNMLEIRGETKEETEGRRGDYFYHERRTGSFQRSIALPIDVQTEQCKASYENGVLTLRLPKAEQAKPKQIKIQPK